MASHRSKSPHSSSSSEPKFKPETPPKLFAGSDDGRKPQVVQLTVFLDLPGLRGEPSFSATQTAFKCESAEVVNNFEVRQKARGQEIKAARPSNFSLKPQVSFAGCGKAAL